MSGERNYRLYLKPPVASRARAPDGTGDSGYLLCSGTWVKTTLTRGPTLHRGRVPVPAVLNLSRPSTTVVASRGAERQQPERQKPERQQPERQQHVSVGTQTAPGSWTPCVSDSARPEESRGSTSDRDILQRIDDRLGRHIDPLGSMKPEQRAIVSERLQLTVGAGALNGYAATAERVRRAGGDLSVGSFVQYTVDNPSIKPATLRQYKSHVTKVREIELQPFTQSEDAILNAFVAGSATLLDQGRFQRGAVSRQQLSVICEDLFATQMSQEKKVMWRAAWYLQYHATLRPHELETITPEHFAFTADTLLVFSVRKASSMIVMQRGTYEVHFVHDKSVWPNLLRILREGLKRGATAPMFPGYNYSLAGQFVKKVADARGWNRPGGPQIDGTHSLRHGHASEIFLAAVKSTIAQTGAWRSIAGASNYVHLADQHTLIRKSNLGTNAGIISEEESRQEVCGTIAALEAAVAKYVGPPVKPTAA